MTNFLDENFGAEATPVNLESLVETRQLPTISLPEASIRNRAATTAMLTDDQSKSVENYQLMMQEANAGSDKMLNSLQEGIVANTQKGDMKGIISVLSDPKISTEEKEKVISGVKQSQFLKDSGNTLFTNSLSRASKGENIENEDARLSSAGAIAEIYESRNAVQGLVNAHGASLRDAGIEAVGEMAATWVMPFGNNVVSGRTAAAFDKSMGNDSLWKTIKRYALAGSSTADMREKLESVPPEKRAEFAQSLLTTIKDNSGIIFANSNHFAQWDKATQIFDEGGYSSTQEFIDNVSPLLDIIGLGQAFRGGAKAAKVAGKAGDAAGAARAQETVIKAEWELVNDAPSTTPPLNRQLPNPQKRLDVPDQMKRIEMNSVVRKENPAAPANVVASANPEEARNLHAIIVKSQGDEVAEGLHGVNREQAIINDITPQAATESGAVRTKVADIERNLRQEMRVSDELVGAVHNDGAIYYTPAEKAAVRANVVNDFSSAEGLAINDAMSSFAVDGGRIKIGAVYGAGDGGFLRAEDAVEQAKLALRNYGIRDDEIEILAKSGLDHVPVKLEDVAGVDGNYLIRVNTFHEIDPTDITEYAQFGVKRNVLDRVGQLVSKDSGSASRWLFDAASMLHPTYTGAASVASDLSSRFEKIMLEAADKYATKYQALPKERRALVDDYIREANYNGLALDNADLIARGFNGSEIDALRSWRNFWDGHFYLENYDVVRSLNAQGYQKFKNANTELYARPIAKDSTLGGIYDPVADAVVYHSKVEGDIFYAAGGTYAKLRRPTEFNGVRTEYMMVQQSPGNYLRKLRDSDQVLNYRDGYFQLQYKAPKFIDQAVEWDKAGKPTAWKTVAVAGDTKEAEMFAKRMSSTQGLNPTDFKVRGDDRAIRKDSDAYWDLSSASGRIAQRHRGKLLEDGSGLNHLGDGSYIVNPVESAVRAARSISGRTVSRPMIEAAKARFLAQYGDMVPSNGMGGKKWPRSVKEISAKGEEGTKALGDARTTYEYIHYLENGYISGMDTAFKATINMLGNMAGSVGMSRTERGLNSMLEAKNPTSVLKGTVFSAYIGMNPLRQLIVQPHQAIRTYSYNPIGWLNGGVPKYIAGFLGDTMGATPHLSKEQLAFNKFARESGALDAVDKSNLVRGALTDAADSSNALVRGVGKLNAIPRKIGFDVGEQSNLLVHLAAVYERHTRLGKNLADKAMRDMAYSEARAISYDMNFAGDMVYNQTSMAALLQFAQVPHKAFLQATNRRIDRLTRARMISGDILLWGGPTSLVASFLGTDVLPDDPKMRELVVWGAESMLYNEFLNRFLDDEGEKSHVDFSSFAPYDTTGWAKFFHAMLEGGFSELITNSPAGQLLFKDGGRMRNVVSYMGRFFTGFKDEDEDAPTFVDVMTEVAKLSSGFNNATKAKLMLQTQKRLDAYGAVIDQDATKSEAWAQALGFGTADVRDMYKISQDMSKDVKAHKEEVLKVYKEISRYYTEKLQSDNADPKFITKVTGEVLRIYENDPVAQGIINQQLKLDLKDKNSQFIGLAMKRSSIPDVAKFKDQIRQMPIPDEQQKQLMDRVDSLQKLREQNTEKKDK